MRAPLFACALAALASVAAQTSLFLYPPVGFTTAVANNTPVLILGPTYGSGYYVQTASIIPTTSGNTLRSPFAQSTTSYWGDVTGKYNGPYTGTTSTIVANAPAGTVGVRAGNVAYGEWFALTLPYAIKNKLVPI